MQYFEKQKQSSLFLRIFNNLEDPRRVKKGNIRHEFLDIIFLVISAVVSGASNWDEIEMFGHNQLTWLRKYYPFKNGIPSHDTINRVISAISPNRFSECFTKWIQEISDLSNNEVVAIDGKRIRNSHDKHSNKSAIHVVSAFASENNLCLGQVSTHEKSNEITAIPQLLDILSIEGCTVTIDAMGCQKDIATKIISKKADYLLAVKDNQKLLAQGIRDIIRFDSPLDEDNQVDTGHGRIETRICRVFQATNLIENASSWKSLERVIEINSERIIKSTGEKSSQTRYYITSKTSSAKELNNNIRSHWSIENNLHWELDITFGEDLSRKRIKNAAENFNIISKIAMSLLNKEKSRKGSKKAKRFASALNPQFREKVLGI